MALQSQYETEKQLTDSLKACREDISRQEELSALQHELSQIQNNSPLLGLDVDVRTVAIVIADWTGVPLSSLMKDEQTELLTLEEQLATRVVGQIPALNAIAQRLRASKTGLTPENGPQGVFLLVGPSGGVKQKPHWRWLTLCMAVKNRSLLSTCRNTRVAHRFATERLSTGVCRIRPGRHSHRGCA